MRTETPVTVRLADYRAYGFAIDHVSLVFRLDPARTEVESRLEVRTLRTEPMRLDGDGLKLRAIRIAAGTATPTPLEPSEYTLDESGLTLLHPPAGSFTLETLVEIAPDSNTALSGLYISGGRFCTQCEAEGFRRITFFPDRPDVMSRFTVRIEADAEQYPVLLSNGTPGETGPLPGGRHFAVWEDPHRKPSYLFALCAGDYDVLRGTFVTASGREVALGIYVDKGEAPRAAWAMDCLKRAMAWDETAYGREYDLGVFNIVAVRDFNFGAMENKGLNIFNSAYVLADEATATDADFEAIESIVAHEYFHNWTGNRVTCRDWFQLCLKEGLTVFRDQSFSADMRSRSMQRIKDVIRLRARQFTEDAGPLAHAVRPDSYAAIDNLYTATVYEKGAEIIGMLRRLIGPEAFRKGMDLYFERHDGQAVTIEDFYACFTDVSGRDFSAFRRWYTQPGTPEITVREDWDSTSARLTVWLTQRTPPTPGQPVKQALPIPLLCALLDGEGGHLAPLDGAQAEPFLVLFDQPEHALHFDLPDATRVPRLSINRDFSAPIRLIRHLDRREQIHLVRAETDPFNIWEGLQGLVRADILALAYDGIAVPDDDLVEAITAAVRRAVGDPAFAALLLRLPEPGELFLERNPADPVALTAARRRLQQALHAALAPDIRQWLERPSPRPYHPGVEQASVRALRSAFTMLLSAAPAGAAGDVLSRLYREASNMTERLTALRALCLSRASGWRDALEAFGAEWHKNPLVMDKWFSVQASTGSAADVEALVAHPAFDLRNPNRVRAVIGAFSTQNLAAFHAPDGSGYRAVEPVILAADRANAALGARLMTAFEQWRLLEPRARAEAEAALRRMLDAGLSPNARDIASRALAPLQG